MTGQTVLHYRIGERLGAGGMGEVYRAEDMRLGRQVALKFLPSSYQYDEDRRERFYTEARAASALRSPYIAAIYDIGQHEGSSFIVMEYVEGETLSSKIGRGPLTCPEAIDIAMQVADALDEAQALGIVHRDIKSSNLIITGRGLVKVLDFGLAKIIPPPQAGATGAARAVDSDATFMMGQETVAGVVLGTVSYMSPEQSLGRKVDHRSDIFSLGVVIYEMVTGRKPFDGDSATDTIDRIIHQEPQALARFNYDVPPDMERIVRKSLEKDPGYRYQAARELYIDLRNLRRDIDVGKQTASMPLQQPEFSLTSGVSTAFPPSTPHPPARLENSVAVLTFTNITKEPADDWIGSGIAETVTADLKNVRGISVIGRERIFDVLKNIGSGQLQDFDEKIGIGIGRRLGATWIIGGGYQKVSGMIRVTARFVDVETGALVKTVKIDGKIAEIFDLQDKIVYELGRGLNLQLGNSEITEIERDETRSVEAYENFSRGMMNLRMGSRDSLDRAIYRFEKATQLDPEYAMAWAMLGIAYDLKGSFLSIPDLIYKAIEFAQKAISINPRLSEGYEVIGGAYNALGRIDEAIAAIREAMRLDPTNADAHSTLARSYWIGKGMIDEGVIELEQAVALNPESGYAYLQLGLLYALRGDYARAEAACNKAVALQEMYISGKEGLLIVGAYTRLGYVYYRQGRYDEAVREYLRELEFLGASNHALKERTLIEVHQKLGAAYLRVGESDEAARHLKHALKLYEDRVAKGADDPYTKYYIACLHALQGDRDSAIKRLEESSSQLGAMNRVRAKIDPDLDSLRDDPGFLRLLAEP